MSADASGEASWRRRPRAELGRRRHDGRAGHRLDRRATCCRRWPSASCRSAASRRRRAPRPRPWRWASTSSRSATIDQFDITIDGADQIAPDGWLVKGGGAAHTREKIVAAAAARFIVIADSSKTVDALRPPIPLELLEFGLHATLRPLGPVSCATCRGVPTAASSPTTAGPFGDPAELAARLAATPGVVDARNLSARDGCRSH